MTALDAARLSLKFAEGTPGEYAARRVYDDLLKQQDTDPDQPVIDALHQLRDASAEYDPALLAARRAGFVAEIQKRNDPLEDRAAEIEEALQDPFIDKATAFELLDELSAIINQQERN